MSEKKVIRDKIRIGIGKGATLPKNFNLEELIKKSREIFKKSEPKGYCELTTTFWEFGTVNGQSCIRTCYEYRDTDTGEVCDYRCDPWSCNK